MKKLGEKITLIALVCISLIFVVTALLYVTNVITPANSWRENGALGVLLAVLGIVYLGLSAYLIWASFSQAHTIKKLLLLCDSESATHVNTKVIDNIVKNCAKRVSGVTVKKIKIHDDDKKGFVATVTINVSAMDTANTINQLRCLLVDAFANTLGLTFNCIDFVIAKLTTNYKPNVITANQDAKTLTNNQEQVEQFYQQPLTEIGSDNNGNKQDEK